jgi:hypothetical protein
MIFDHSLRNVCLRVDEKVDGFGQKLSRFWGLAFFLISNKKQFKYILLNWIIHIIHRIIDEKQEN